MLKNIPGILSPELLKTLMEMGHGDEICIGDGNFPHASTSTRVIRCDGHNVPDLLDAILQLMPLDTYTRYPAILMAVESGDPVETPIWQEYEQIIAKHDKRGKEVLTTISRHNFYARAHGCYAVVATGEKALYANIILKKGVVVAKG